MYLEDLTPGQRFDLGSLLIDQAESIAYAQVYDPQAMHLDVEGSRNGPFGGLIVSGWYTASLIMKLVMRARTFGGTPVLGLGVDQIRWPMPVRPGDTIHAGFSVQAVTPSRSKPAYGIAKLDFTVRNQNDQVVLTMTTACWVPRRPRE